LKWKFIYYPLFIEWLVTENALSNSSLTILRLTATICVVPHR